MRERLPKLLVTLMLIAAVAVGATAAATADRSSPAKVKAKPADAKIKAKPAKAAVKAKRAKATRTARPATAGAARLLATPTRTQTAAADPDQVEQGDQTTPDTPAEQASENETPGAAESESTTESEQGQPGEPAVGHEDPPSQDVQHECTGNCVE